MKFYLALGLLLLPVSAAASSLIFQDQAIEAKVGQTISVPVSIDPAFEKNYTVRLILTFSPDVLEVTSFTFAKNWIALSRPGYDLIDNQGGELIKTAGYPGGFSETVLFGRVTFRAKKAGGDVVAVGVNSFILNAKSKSSLTSRPRIVVAITGQAQPQISPPAKPLPNLPVASAPSLFDVAAGGNLVTRVAPGELLPISVKLTNFGGSRRADVTINYRILNEAGIEMLASTETVAVETTASFIKVMQIPRDFPPGKYTAESSIVYEGQKAPAISSYQFSVERKVAGIFLSDLILYGLITLFIGLIFAVVSRLVMKKRRVSRFVPHEYPQIPAPDRMFYEIISDIIMQMRYRVGDKALEIAGGIDDLIIEKDSGKVLKIKKAPARIIALLISNYEKSLHQKISFAFGRPDEKMKDRRLVADKNLVVVRKRKVKN